MKVQGFSGMTSILSLFHVYKYFEQQTSIFSNTGFGPLTLKNSVG